MAAADYNIANFNTLPISDLYEDEEVWRYLMDRAIGIDQENCRDKIVEDGFDSLRSVVRHHTNNVEGFKTYLVGLNKTFASSSVPGLRVYYSPVAIARTLGVIHLYDQAVNTFHCIPDASYVNRGYADDLASIYEAFTKLSDDVKDDIDVQLPALTGSSNWVDFRDKFKMKLSLTIGNRGFPLDYVIDNTARPVRRGNANLLEVDEIDLSEDNLYVTSATQFGAPFNKDNTQVWNLLKSHLLGTPVYNHIANCDATSNGRKAWTLMTEFYEGEDFKTRMKDTAFSKIMNTFYRGDSIRFSFEKYISVHKQAHKMLEDANYNNGMGLDDSTKCHHFIAGIKEQAGLEYALCTARSNPQYRDFTSLTSFLTAEVDHKNIRKQQLKSGRSKDRNVSGVKGDKAKKRNNNKDFPSKMVDGKMVYGKRYSNPEYRKLTNNQKDAVRQLQKEARNRRNNNDKDHTVKSITLDDLTVFGDAIVAGVRQAQVDAMEQQDSGNEDTVASEITTSTKRKAPSGGVRNFIAQRKTKKGGK